MQPSQATTETRVRHHFEEQAGTFDALYNEDRFVQRTLRPGLHRRREFALDVIRSYGSPAVLDVGCGSGRIGEDALAGGAARYVGVDFSEPMLDLARRRLARFGDRAEIVQADFLSAELEGPFDVVLGLGLFDYVAEPHLFTRRMYELCSGEVVASFPKWTWLKGPIRKVRYEVVNDCPIFNYTRRELTFLFAASGFTRITIAAATRSGYLVRAFR